MCITAEAETNVWGGNVISKGDFQTEARELEKRLMGTGAQEADADAEGGYVVVEDEEEAEEELDERQTLRTKRGLRKLKAKE